MASASISPAVADQPLRTPRSAPIVASYLKTVLLHEWWLIKVDANSTGRLLGVGGYAARKGQAIRTFHSAAIVKRYDATTLETADGIEVTVTGFINRSRTLESGFTFEVCNHFLIGFPYSWEKYAGVHLPEESCNRSLPPGVSWNDLPVTQVRDILISSREDCGDSAIADTILNDILHEFGGDIACNSETKRQKRDNGHGNSSSTCTRNLGIDKTVPESKTATGVNSYRRVTRSQTVRKDREELPNVPSGGEAVNSRLFATPPKQNRNDAAVNVNDEGVPMCSSDTENKGAEEIVQEPGMSADVNSSSRRVGYSKAKKLSKCATPVRRSNRLRKLP